MQKKTLILRKILILSMLFSMSVIYSDRLSMRNVEGFLTKSESKLINFSILLILKNENYENTKILYSLIPNDAMISLKRKAKYLKETSYHSTTTLFLKDDLSTVLKAYSRPLYVAIEIIDQVFEILAEQVQKEKNFRLEDIPYFPPSLSIYREMLPVIGDALRGYLYDMESKCSKILEYLELLSEN